MQFSLELHDVKPKERFIFTEEVLFPTYMLVVRENNEGVKPTTIFTKGKHVNFNTLSAEEKQKPIYQVLTMDDDFQISGIHIHETDISVLVDGFNLRNNVELYNPQYIPKVKLTETDVRFVTQHDMCGRLYTVNKGIFLSYWNRGLKSFNEVNERAEKQKPQYDVKAWSTLATKHNKGKLSIVHMDNTVMAIEDGNVIASELRLAITPIELEHRLNVTDSVNYDIYRSNREAYQALGITANESLYRKDGVSLNREQTLSLMQISGNAIKLPDDITFDKETYADIKSIFTKANGKYHNSGFVFSSTQEARDMFNRLLDGENINVKKSLQYFATTEAAAATFLDGVNLTGKVVFEPNGGEGFLVRKAYELGASHVKSAEIYQYFHPALKASGAEIIGDDLLTLTAQDVADVDVVIMNPPFTGGLDVKHVEHVLSIIPEHASVHSIMSGSLKTNSTSVYSNFRAKLQKMGVPIHDIEQGAFASSGTNVKTVHITIPSRLDMNNLVD